MNEFLPNEINCPPWLNQEEMEKLKNPFRTFMKKNKLKEERLKAQKPKTERKCRAKKKNKLKEKKRKTERKCRAKKKAKIASLVKSVEEYEIKNSSYKQEISRLKKEVYLLRNGISFNLI